jgi:hypothetical protein
MLCQRRQLSLGEAEYEAVREVMPLLLTPGAAETLAVKVYRVVRTESKSPLDALRSALIDYQNPVPLEILQAQITLAVRETSDLEFVPTQFRTK